MIFLVSYYITVTVNVLASNRRAPVSHVYSGAGAYMFSYSAYYASIDWSIPYMFSGDIAICARQTICFKKQQAWKNLSF